MTIDGTAESEFRRLCAATGDPIGVSLLLFLAWVSASDGEVAEVELKVARSIVGNGPCSAHLPALIRIVRGDDASALEAAARIVRQRVVGEGRRLFMQLVMRVALADEVLRTTESHVLRFVADVLSLSPAEVSDIFRELTGHPFPVPGDPSRAAWWQGQQQGPRAAAPPPPPATAADPKRMRAFATLGVEETATSDEVRSAYRRLSLVHHPDRFASLGHDAVAAASESFRRIQDAYEYLTRRA